MLALPANAAMWVGGEIGGNIITNQDLKASGAGYSPALGQAVGFSVTYKNVAFNPAVIGGLSVGYDFVNAGFGAYAWPDWMQYFGVIADFTYNRVSIPNQRLPVSGVVTASALGNVTANLFPSGVSKLFPNAGDSIDGNVCALAFLLYGHYGFFPDSQITIGRVHPYLGVGPGIAWTTLNLGPYGLGSSTSTNIALACEGGLRFILLPNVTADIGVRYRYLTPSWSKSGNMAIGTNSYGFLKYPGTVYLTPAALKASVDSVNSLSFLLRVNYHF